MKKVFNLFLILALVLTFAACSKKNNTSAPSSGNSSTNTTTAQPPRNTSSAPSFTEGVWPDNEWTAQLPKPTDGTVGKIDTRGDRNQTLSINMNWSREEAVEYAKAVRNNGFTINVLAYYEDTPSLSTLIEAKNATGYELTVTTSEIRIVKP